MILLGDVGQAEGVAKFMGGCCLDAPLVAAPGGTVDVPVVIGLVQLDVGLDHPTAVGPPAGQSEIARWESSEPDHVVPVPATASTSRADVGCSAGRPAIPRCCAMPPPRPRRPANELRRSRET